MGKRSIGNYFAFRWMITPDIIKILYILGMILLNLSMLAGVISGTAALFMRDFGLETKWLVLIAIGGVIVSFILAIIFNLLFRMFCEQVILFFSIHETLVSIDEGSKDMSKEYKKASRNSSPPPPPK